MSKTTFNTKGLDAFIKALKKVPKAKVGVMSKDDSREDGQSNATIGLKHEFGESGMPIRSFLRVPLSDHFNNKLEQSGAIDKETLETIVDEKSLKIWLEKMGALGVSIVLEGFSTGGFGKWKKSNMTRKKNKETLVESTQLRDSVTWEVK